MNYDDWKTANPFESDDCGHARPCPPCPIRERGEAHPVCWCDHDREDEENPAHPGPAVGSDPTTKPKEK